ncbi:MAG: serine/threonine-protein kinase [Polyangia bacterium]|jgi:serine/threonine-protein kinase|nr:serine/threonine-protein kinase [Polyangia bacterium]
MSSAGTQGGGIFAQVDEENPPVLNPEVGQVVGPIRLTAKLGEGAMAAVFRGERTGTGEPVALKVLKAELCQNLDAMRRFDKEALVAQKARHPSLIEITDVLHVEGIPPVLVMELLEGEDLASVVQRQGPMQPDQAVAVATQLCGALDAMHQQNIVHRDLKPENIFLVGGADGYPVAKLLDFGLVKFLYGGDPFLHTRPGTTLGTPAFMAPEQFSNPDIDNLVDIYALGAVLYEMLTGRPPFVTDNYSERVRLVTTKDPEPPSVHAPKGPEGVSAIPRALDQVILACLARKPQDRVQSAAELRDLLEASLEAGGKKLAMPKGVGVGGSRLPLIIGSAVGAAAILGLLAWLALR